MLKRDHGFITSIIANDDAPNQGLTWILYSARQMKPIYLLSLLIITLASCGNENLNPDGYNSASSLLSAYARAQAQPTPKHLKQLCYRPESVETFGQDWDEFLKHSVNPELAIRNMVLEELDGTNPLVTEKSHNGVSAVSIPKPIGWLRVNFINCDGITDRYSKVLYGKVNGKYYISTWQRPATAE